MRVRRWVWLAALIAAPATAAGQQPTPPDTAVRAILFYSPACPHCQEVITTSLPPILDRYGARLQIAGVNTSTPGGEQLFRAAIEHLAIPPERVGVPTLIVGSSVLVGALEIPGRLPGIVDEGLQGAGIDWPDVPLIRQALAAQGVVARSEPAGDTAEGDSAGAPPGEPSRPPAAARSERTEEPQPEPRPGPESGADTARTGATTPPPDAPGTETETPDAEPPGEADARAASDLAGVADPAARAATPLAGAIDPDARAALVRTRPSSTGCGWIRQGTPRRWPCWS